MRRGASRMLASSRTPGQMPGSSGQGGFTLVELMVTVACITILGALAVPRLQGYLLEARLNAAKPYLMEIAARQRMYKVETGSYCCGTYDGSSEDKLISALPASLADIGDFCFVFVCPTAGNGCTGTSASSTIIVPGTTAPEFEVWAILRNTTGTTSVAGPGTSSCTPATAKTGPSGWVRASNSGLAGRAGQAIALRYPPPTNGRTASNGAWHAVPFDWQDGITVSDALSP